MAVKTREPGKRPARDWSCPPLMADWRLSPRRAGRVSRPPPAARPLHNMAATRKVADHTLYHLSPKGFWKKFSAYIIVMHLVSVLISCPGDAVVVNPEISSGLPIQGVHRYPPPASRPEKYSTPATKGAMASTYLTQTVLTRLISFGPRPEPLLEA